MAWRISYKSGRLVVITHQNESKTIGEKLEAR